MFLTNRQARQFLLLRHGLLGEYRFAGKQGALEFIRQSGCIQFDPVDVCGKNAELTLQSRVKGFQKRDLWELLYQDRALIDYPDKNTAILPVEDWLFFARYRKAAEENGRTFPEIKELQRQAKAFIEANGPVSSEQLPVEGEIHWHSAIHWSGDWHGKTKAARAVLEQMYCTGELVIHHKEGARKVYDLACRHLPQEILEAPDPLPDEFEHLKWRICRRIGAVGLLWNRPSDAWLHIEGMNAQVRARAFQELLQEGKIIEVQVEGLKSALYAKREDVPLLESVLTNPSFTARCEVIAPLDCLLWDRKLIQALFDFHYQWEIYTPKEKRKYGYYVLPLLEGERFVGRVEAAADEKQDTLRVLGIWLEDGVRNTKSLQMKIEKCMKRLAKLNGCGKVAMEKKEELSE